MDPIGQIRTIKQLMEEPPAFRPDLSFKRDPTKDYIEKTLAIEAWMEQLELEAQREVAFGSPTGESGEWDDW